MEYGYYILAQYIYSYIKRNGKMRAQIGIFLFILLFNLIFFNTHLLMLTSRIPLFYLGMIWASKAVKKEKLINRDKILIICSMVIGMIWLLVNFLFVTSIFRCLWFVLVSFYSYYSGIMYVVIAYFEASERSIYWKQYS